MIISAYLDEIILMGACKAEMLKQVEILVKHLQTLGFIINMKKSILTSTQCLPYLGVEIDSRNMRLYTTAESLKKIQSEARTLLSCSKLTVRKMASFLGLITSSMKTIPTARLNQRYLLCNFIESWKRQEDWNSIMSLDQNARKKLLWWMSLKLEDQWTPIQSKNIRHDLILTTDASMSGWGYHLKDQTNYGMWSQTDSLESLNLRELKAIYLALKEESQSMAGKSVLIRTDNTTAIANIKKEGTTKSEKLMKLTKKIFSVLKTNKITLRMEHIAGVDNHLADRLSRMDSYDWKLSRLQYQKIEKKWGPFTLDTFATQMNRQTKRYLSI